MRGARVTHIGIQVVLIRGVRSAILSRWGCCSLFSLPCIPLALLLAALEFPVRRSVMFNASMTSSPTRDVRLGYEFACHRVLVCSSTL